MDRIAATEKFHVWAQKGRFVYRLGDLAKLFPNDNPKTLQEGVNRLVKARILERVSRGVYVFSYGSNRTPYLIEEIAKALRRGSYNYVSLESALSEYGCISQIPIERLTVMTSGREGEYNTPFGTIEFTHTKRGINDIISNVRNVGRPLRMATKWAAWRDLKRVGRNTHLVDEECLDDD